MPKKIPKNTKAKVEAKDTGGEKYILQLFVAGILPNSVRAIENINAICKQYLNGNYELEIIDIYQQPALALAEDIIAVPLLIKKLPLPQVRLFGDMSDIEAVLKGLHLFTLIRF